MDDAVENFKKGLCRPWEKRSQFFALSPIMKFQRTLQFVLPILLMQVISPVSNAQESITSSFEEYDKVNSGDRVLFIRRRPIVASAFGFEPQMIAWMADIVTIYAKASALSLSFSTENVNLIIIKADKISREGRLNPDVLTPYAVPPHMFSLMDETPIWSSGCGFYNFRDSDGNLSGSIGLVETSLNQDKQNSCVSFIIAASFGLGNDLSSTKTFLRDDNIFKYAYALNIVYRCDRENQLEPIIKVKNCAASEASSINLER